VGRWASVPPRYRLLRWPSGCRRAQDAIAEVHHFTTRSYEWIVEADIEACFDRIDHTALMGRVS
jgi:retron-type reverse transcriptase